MNEKSGSYLFPEDKVVVLVENFIWHFLYEAEAEVPPVADGSTHEIPHN